MIMIFCCLIMKKMFLWYKIMIHIIINIVLIKFDKNNLNKFINAEYVYIIL